MYALPHQNARTQSDYQCMNEALFSPWHICVNFYALSSHVQCACYFGHEDIVLLQTANSNIDSIFSPKKRLVYQIALYDSIDHIQTCMCVCVCVCVCVCAYVCAYMY